MGGSIALMVVLGQKIKIKHCIMDGGITPYQLPWIVTRFIASKDYLMMMIGRTGGVALLEKAFDSCNNYKVPDPVPKVNIQIHYSKYM